MKEKIILLLFGLFIGASCAGLAYPLFKRYALQTPEGSTFENLDEFRKAMLVRDDRDQKKNGSVSLRSIITPHSSDLIMYDLLPGTDVQFQRVPVSTNTCGMRDKEIEIPKTEDSYRIALLGDSYAFGWGVNEDESFASVIEQTLNNQKTEELEVEVLNFGIPGYSTFQQVALFEDRVLDFKPDAVLVYFIENDFGLPFFIKDVHQSGEVVTGTDFAKKSWTKKDEKINKQNDSLLNQLNPNKSLKKLVLTTKERGIDLFLAINPRREWKEDRNRLWVLNKNPHIHHIRLRRDFMNLVSERKIPVDTLTLGFDPHPSVIKHRLLGELLAAGMQPYLPKKPTLN